jgi:hypothetical protein
VRITTIKLVAHQGTAPFCEWCGHRKTPGSTHGELETTDKDGSRLRMANIQCVVIEYGDVTP